MRHTRRIRSFTRTLAASLALGAGLAACEGSTAPDAGMTVHLSITREVQGAEASTILPFKPQVTVRPGEIDIFGNIRMPSPCYGLSSAVAQEGQTITMTVTATVGEKGVCAQVITVRDYSAQIRNVKSGTYTLRVQHVFDLSSREPDLVLEEKIVVP